MRRRRRDATRRAEENTVGVFESGLNNILAASLLKIQRLVFRHGSAPKGIFNEAAAGRPAGESQRERDAKKIPFGASVHSSVGELTRKKGRGG